MSIPTHILRKHEKAIDELFRHGILSYKIYLMLPVRDKIDSLMRTGKSHGEAVNHVAKELKMSRQNVYNYL